MHFFKAIFIILIGFSCNPRSNILSKPILDNDTNLTKNAIKNNSIIDSNPLSIENEIVTHFVVIADTGQNYYSLKSKMVSLSLSCKFRIDSNGNYYNPAKDLICIHDNSEDEIYAGEYFMRRNGSDYLSLEYLDWYQDKASKKTIAIIAGIFESEKDAEKMVVLLKPYSKNAYKIKSDIYMGCIH